MLYRKVNRTTLPIALEQAKAHLRVTHDLEDTLINSLIIAATNWAEQYTGRAFSVMQIVAYTESISGIYSIDRFLPLDAIQAVKTAQNAAVSFSYEWPNKVTINDTLADDQYPLSVEYTTSIAEIEDDVINAILIRLQDMYDYRTDRFVPLTREGNSRRVSEDLLQMYKLNNFVV